MKNKLLPLLFAYLLVMGIKSYGQTGTDSAVVPFKPEKNIEFNGGLTGWSRFLENNLDRNLLQKNNAPAGGFTTVADFVVDSVGNVRDIKIIIDPGYGVADEFVRVLKLSSKKWIPAYDKGKAISYRRKQSLTLRN